ncbi:MAG: SDR family NAD(P)-dependent oxidoreductase [Flavobacteriales bacterium]|nr:SDR family NAD(P)-dependent oxidoreductase [Flavobacteriales bacterium]
MNLENKVCIITGVSKGIGLALTRQLLNENAIVVGLGRTKPNVENNNFNFIETDVRNAASVESAINKVVAQYANIHVLVNNAGLGYFGKIEDHTLQQWHEMFETNVNGIFYTSRLIVPIMKKQQEGHIFNIASTAGLEGYPLASGYCGTKYAVKGISQSMYKEMREDGIKVTCVYPGSVKTDFFRNSAIEPHDNMLMPDDVALLMVQALKMPFNFHQVNLEVRPLQPKGKRTT